MWDCLILLCVLSPVEPPVSSEVRPEAWQALKNVSLEMEIVGPHERLGDRLPFGTPLRSCPRSRSV